MNGKLENGACISAVMTPKCGVTVTSSGSHHDVCATFGILCYEFLKTGVLSYDDMRCALTSAVIMETTLLR